MSEIHSVIHDDLVYTIVRADSPVSTTVVTTPAVIHSVVGVPGLQGASGVPETVEMVAGEVLGGHRVVIVDDTNSLIYADPNDIGHAFRVIGITSHACLLGGTARVQRYGVMVEPSWNWELGKPIYLGASGILTQVYPNSKIIFIIGFPVKSTEMIVNIQAPLIEEN